MANLGQTHAQTMMGEDDHIDYPTIHLSGDQVNDIGLWQFDVGDTTKMMATIRIASKSKDSGEDRHVTIELVEAMVEKPKGVDATKMFPTMTVAAPARISK